MMCHWGIMTLSRKFLSLEILKMLDKNLSWTVYGKLVQFGELMAIWLVEVLFNPSKIKVIACIVHIYIYRYINYTTPYRNVFVITVREKENKKCCLCFQEEDMDSCSWTSNFQDVA